MPHCNGCGPPADQSRGPESKNIFFMRTEAHIHQIQLSVLGIFGNMTIDLESMIISKYFLGLQ